MSARYSVTQRDAAPKLSMAAKLVCLILAMAVDSLQASAATLPDSRSATFSPANSSSPVESDGLIQRGRDVLRSFGNGKQPARKADSGKTPKLVLSATGVDYEQSHLRLGDSMKRWKEVLKGKPRCSEEKPVPVICVWDDMGIELLTEGAKHDRVIQLAVHLSFDDRWWMKTPTKNADGTPAAPAVDWTPRHPFNGYLEVDGVGIDAETTLSSLLAGVKRERNFRCGPFDCTAARGILGIMTLQAEPQGRTAGGIIRRVSVGQTYAERNASTRD